MLVTLHTALATLLLVTIALSLLLELALFRDFHGRHWRLRRLSDRLMSAYDPIGALVIIVGFFAYDITIWYVSHAVPFGLLIGRNWHRLLFLRRPPASPSG